MVLGTIADTQEALNKLEKVALKIARKRRRPNQDLQQRLARCEELLQEYATAKPPSASAEPSNVDESWKTQGSLIVDESGVRFMDSFLWAEVHTEVTFDILLFVNLPC